MDSDDELELVAVATATVAIYYFETYVLKERIRDSILTGHAYVMEKLTRHPQPCRDLFRMEQHSFIRLCKTLTDRGLLKVTRHMSCEEQLGIFLMTIGHNERNRMVCDRFQHSGETISRHFNKVLRAISELSISLIRPPSFDVVPSYIRHNPKYWPYFKGCIGAIDGTHVSAHIPLASQVPFRGRKGITQNVMAACSFDMRFTFVNAGWEGSANDWKVFLETINNPSMNFPRPPPGKYYVVDAGYPNMTGFLAPFRGVRYHLQDYRRNRAQTRKEMFNHRHSSLRNVIERTFGVLKARFPILKLMPSYPFPTQVYIVIACMTIHNFIRQEVASDWLLRQYENEDNYPMEEDEDSSEDDEPDFSTHASFSGSSQRLQQLQMEQVRDSIANAIGRDGGAVSD
ncbi:hypothetical protein ACHQM5_009102 [Ranunculus cassubicifolius]